MANDHPGAGSPALTVEQRYLALVQQLWDIAGKFPWPQCNAIRDPIHHFSKALATPLSEARTPTEEECVCYELRKCSGRGRPSCTMAECMYGVEPCPDCNGFKPKGAPCNFSHQPVEAQTPAIPSVEQATQQLIDAIIENSAHVRCDGSYPTLIPTARIDALIAAVRAASSPQQNWQPIATAPLNGDDVIVVDANALVGQAFWNRADRRWDWLDNEPVALPIQGWMPIPAPPAEKGSSS